MRKLISVTLMGVLMTGFGIGISGCSDEASTKSQVTVKDQGGTTTRTVEDKTTTSGANPPAPSKTP
jgi:hypothetical protein